MESRSMKVVAINKFGGWEVLELIQLPIPQTLEPRLESHFVFYNHE